MDRSLMFLCHTKEQLVATKKMLEDRGDRVYWADSVDFPKFPVVAYSFDTWVGFKYPCLTVDNFLYQGRKLIDLKEHLARGGY